MSSLVFFGAGTSKPFGIPTMQEIMSGFEQDLEKKNSKLFTFYTGIKDILKQETSIKIDIESMLSVITGIAENKPLNEINPFLLYSTKKISDDSKFMKSSPDDIDTAKELKQKLHNYIKNACKLKDSDMSATYKKTYFPFFKHIPGNSTVHDEDIEENNKLKADWKAYTTNYDNVFEFFWDDHLILSDHFQKIGQSKLYGFESNPLPSGGTFCKLHGSLDWTKKLNQGKIMRKTQSNYSKYGPGNDVMLFPIQQKDLYLDPWSSLFADLKYGLLEKQYWYAVGYAFNDIIIKDIFEKSIMDNKDKKLVIIDPNAYEIKNKFDKSIQDKVDALPIKFDDDHFETKISDYTSNTKTIILRVRADQKDPQEKLFRFAIVSQKSFKSKNITPDCDPHKMNPEFQCVINEKKYSGCYFEFDSNNLSGIRLELKVDCPYDEDIILHLSDNTRNIDFGIWYCNNMIFSSNYIKKKDYVTNVSNNSLWLKDPIIIDKTMLYSKEPF
ncbi:MAG: hypothetical protein EB828_04530 [Nitrosopumilus sp. D6]|nr:MAG: hypothetical protein EB828_04530 [Nitrosopumilus sp. D6]